MSLDWRFQGITLCVTVVVPQLETHVIPFLEETVIINYSVYENQLSYYYALNFQAKYGHTTI